MSDKSQTSQEPIQADLEQVFSELSKEANIPIYYLRAVYHAPRDLSADLLRVTSLEEVKKAWSVFKDTHWDGAMCKIVREFIAPHDFYTLKWFHNELSHLYQERSDRRFSGLISTIAVEIRTRVIELLKLAGSGDVWAAKQALDLASRDRGQYDQYHEAIRQLICLRLEEKKKKD